jgi:hypothetical protein
MQVVCHCGKAFEVRRHRLQPDQCCSRSCRKIAPEPDGTGTFDCRGCKQTLPATKFHWYRDPRYSSGWRRLTLCDICANDRSRVYHQSHKVEARIQHEAWRRVNLEAQGLKSLRFWFARQLGGYRKRARDNSLPFNLTLDDLVGLYIAQRGNCYYTGDTLTWGHSKLSPQSLSLDRRTPQLGYIVGNVVLCHFHINTMKGARTEEEFYAECARLLSVHNSRQAQCA